MNRTLDEVDLDDFLAPILDSVPPAHGNGRVPDQPVHTVYGGAHLFRADTARRIGLYALKHFDLYFPDFVTFAEALELKGHERLPPAEDRRVEILSRLEMDPLAVPSDERPVHLAASVHRRVRRKLETQPVEDFRIDFEDGYGPRSETEEDGHAVSAAREVVSGRVRGTLPPRLGLRIRPLDGDQARRALRTLDLFVTALAEAADEAQQSQPTEFFVVTLPKVVGAGQVAALARILGELETRLGLDDGSLGIELMIERPESLLDSKGHSPLPSMLDAADGRCVGCHFGVYDYTAAFDVIAAHQRMDHPSCDYARHAMQLATSGRGVHLSDGASNDLPVGPYRQTQGGPPLSELEQRRNRRLVHRVSRMNYRDIRHSLSMGFYQGWDLHPSQLPVRYAAVYSFFLEHLHDMVLRLRSFMDGLARANLVGATFDDAASGQALLNFFLRGLACGALSEDEAAAGGLTVEELRSRSFARIVEARRRGAPLGSDKISMEELRAAAGE